MRSTLRVYSGPDTTESTSDAAYEAFSRPSIPMTVSELMNVLVDATLHRRAWVDDFKNDEIMVSPDLYEVILAYQHYHRPSA